MVVYYINPGIMIIELYEKIINGKNMCYDEAVNLIKHHSCEELCRLADDLRQYFTGNSFDMCSITNARSGRCSEDCKWCAQSSHYKTKIDTYELVDPDFAIEQAINNEKKGVHRYSLVTSGRKVNDNNLQKLIDVYKKISEKSDIHLCASMGLLSKDQLKMLKEAGIGHYHCNLETARSYFPELCTTHTYEEKVLTIKAAQEIGLSVCSGGIIGMGETMEQRIELAIELRELGILSIPINFLMPVEGTPLESAQQLSDDEILTTLAIFRIINPTAMIRFAGGRQLIKHIQQKALQAGVSAALVGDLLTTVGSDIDEDICNFKNAGFKLKTLNSKHILEYDKKHIWHPYTSMTNPLPVQLVESVNGYEIKLADGTVLIDGMSSWWAAIHGYNNKVLNQAITDQLNKMAHIMFGGLTHKPAVDLAKKLIEITPTGLEHVFFSDSGSVSVEVAMKMALQYWQSKQEHKKTEFSTIRKGYHGDTWHAMSVCDPTTGMHSLFKEGLSKQNFVTEPKVTFYEEWNPDDLSEMHELLSNKHDTIAAVIIEPIVQGAGGMRFYHPRYLSGLKELCTKYNVLLIADEIATGFGRTGELFACNFEDITPDILCLGKAITGGYMSFAATLTTSDVAHTISKGEPSVFMHGPTFMGNPLACAVANASIDLLLSQDWKSNIRRIEKRLKVGLEPAKQFSQVADVRVLGAIGVIELKKQVDMAKIQTAFIEKGIWIRPFGKLVYTMPPYIIDNDALDKLTSGMVEVVET